MKKGMIVVVEGFDGSGKSAVAEELTKQLQLRGVEVVTTRQPGGTPFAEKCREVLMSGTRDRDQRAEAAVFLAARFDLYYNFIKPAVEAGKVVVCDRHYVSSLVNQPLATDMILQNPVFEPDLLVYTECPLSICLEREAARKEQDAFSSEGDSIKEGQFERLEHYKHTLPDRCKKLFIDTSDYPSIMRFSTTYITEEVLKLHNV